MSFRKFCLLAAFLLGITGNVPAQSPTMRLTRADKGINRVEMYGAKPGFKGNYYINFEESGAKSMYKLRLQAFPFQSKKFGFGVAAQQLGKLDRSVNDTLGYAFFVKAQPTKSSAFRAEFQYFPETDSLDNYTFLNSKRVYFDSLGSYHTATGKMWIRPGFDVKLSKRFYAGLEGKFEGDAGNLNKNYLGLRAKWHW